MTFRLILGLALAAGLTTACGEDGDPGPPVNRDLAAIEARDTLEVLLAYNETSYFLYRGEPMGFEYELLRQFARERELELRTVVVRDPSRILHALNEGAGDVVAARLVATRRHVDFVAHTRPLYTTRPALVQRTDPADSLDLPEPVDTVLTPRGERSAPVRPSRIRARLISRPGQLSGRDVHVPARSFYHDRLVELSDSVTGEIHVVEVDSVSHERLIRQLSRGEIELTVAPENVAMLKESYFSNLTVRPVLGPRHQVVWGVRPNAPSLLAALNDWIATKQGDGTIDALYRRYFVDRMGYRERVASEYLTSETGRLSEYDDLLRRHAPSIGWDWRLLASQAYQESRFQPRARSWAGAMGLLQLMPATAREVNVHDPYDPDQNVAGAVRYLEWLTRQWEEEIVDPAERLRFVLASYNTGFGHVSDARRLAEKNGDDPDRWEHVSYWLLQKSRTEVYSDPVVRYGFARGLEPVTYVALILERFDHYREFVQG